MIKLNHLQKKYGETTILDDVCFDFPNKGLVCLLGKSGSGKSTLLHLLAGFDTKYNGDIFVHEQRLSELNCDELCNYRRDNIGFVFQNYQLIHGYTVLENILLASDLHETNSVENLKIVTNLLNKLGIADKINQKVENLSGGQKQRVALARALINQPSIILADEPTGALDRKNSNEIMQLLKTISQSHLVIVVTHDKKCAEVADAIITINHGKIISETEVNHSDETTSLHQNIFHKPSLWKRAYQNFKLHLIQNIAIALSISIGVLCFCLSLSSGNILDKSINEFKTNNTAYNNGFIKIEENEEELLQILNQDQRLENIYPQYILQNVSLTMDKQTIILEKKYPLPKATEKMSYGHMPKIHENEIALNPSLASKFDSNIQNIIGKNMVISYHGQQKQVTISGIFNATYDDYLISSDIEQSMYEYSSGPAYSISYDVSTFEDIVTVSNDLKNMQINCQNASNEVNALLQTFQNLKRLFLTISTLILLIGCIIGTILLIKQQNTRYHEMGLLSALGYTKKSIQNILSYENINLSVLTALCSSILILLTLFFSHILNLNISLSFTQIILTLLMSSIFILMISYFSCIKLVKIDPIDALKK